MARELFKRPFDQRQTFQAWKSACHPAVRIENVRQLQRELEARYRNEFPTYGSIFSPTHSPTRPKFVKWR